MNYRSEKNRILVSLEKGDEIMDCIYKIIDNEEIPFGWINGIGAIQNIIMGSYSLSKKNYIKKQFKGEFELTSLIGNITTKQNKPFVHIHINIADNNCRTYGGHLFSAIITATCEIIILKTEKKVYRNMNDDIGLYLWDLNYEK